MEVGFMLLPLARTATVVFTVIFFAVSPYAQTLPLPQSLIGAATDGARRCSSMLLRKAIGQELGGHISPLAAFDAESDRFLILDVAATNIHPCG
jgi:hypothetical protein